MRLQQSGLRADTRNDTLKQLEGDSIVHIGYTGALLTADEGGHCRSGCACFVRRELADTYQRLGLHSRLTLKLLLQVCWSRCIAM